MKVGDILKIPFALGIFCLMSSSVFAIMEHDARVAELENQMSQVATKTANDTFGANTASARPNVDGVHWFVTVDPLFWRTRIGGTEYAYTDQDPVATVPVKGRIKHMEYDWDWGIRVGVGYNFEHDQWDLLLQYTWWKTGTSDSARAGLNSTIIPIRGSVRIGNPDFFRFCTSAKSQLGLDFSAIDLELGRDYYVSSKISFRPHWGLKTAWIDMHQLTRYTGGPVIPDFFPHNILGLERNTVRVKEDSDFFGIGPRTGINTRWYFGENFSGILNASAAALFGFFDVDHKERFSALETNNIRIHANRHAFVPTIQGQVGLQYARYLLDNQYHITLSVMFEAQYWWRQNQMLKIRDTQTFRYNRYSEDLTILGLTFHARWDF